MSEREFNLPVDETRAGSRLDTFICLHVAGCSRSYAATLIRGGIIRVGGEQKKPGYRLRTGEQITGCLPVPEAVIYAPEPLDLDILYEDADIIVLNKPPGLVVHPAPGHLSGTLVNGLLHHCPDLEGIGGKMRPGIVHRLDKDTSGTLVVAKNSRAHADLGYQFKYRTVSKTYLALVHGEPKTDAGTIDLPVGRHPVERKKMAVNNRNGRRAETLWKIEKRFSGLTLLRIKLMTGRTHQIRVHCAAIRHPVAGDPVYGGKRNARQYPPDIARLLANLNRQMLHAWKLGFSHPSTGRDMAFESPMPEDMENLIRLLSQ